MFYQTLKGVYTPNLFQKFFYLKHKKEIFFANKSFNLFFKWHVDECTRSILTHLRKETQ